jgi:hypothetical protein
MRLSHARHATCPDDVVARDTTELTNMGFDALPGRHGARLTIFVVQLPPPEPDDGCGAPLGATSSSVEATRRLNAMPVRALDEAIDRIATLSVCLCTCVSCMFMIELGVDVDDLLFECLYRVVSDSWHLGSRRPTLPINNSDCCSDTTQTATWYVLKFQGCFCTE